MSRFAFELIHPHFQLTTTGIARRTTSTTNTKSNIKTSHKFDTKTTTTTTSVTITTTLASIHVTYPKNMVIQPFYYIISINIIFISFSGRNM